jgi:hypothetical protein
MYVRLGGDDATLRESTLEEIEGMIAQALRPPEISLTLGDITLLRLVVEDGDRDLTILIACHCTPPLGRDEALNILLRAGNHARRVMPTWGGKAEL